MKKSQYRYSRLLSLAILALPLAACDNDTQSGSGVERPKAGQPNQPGPGTTTTTTGADTMPDITTGTTTDSGLPDTTTPDTGSTSSSDSTSSSTTTTTTTTDSSSSSTDTSSSDDSSSSDTDSSGTDPKADWKGDNFEGTVGDWELDEDKIWKIGAPAAPAGPNAKGGNNVIGTVLDGDYPTGRVEAVLRSPEFVIPKGESARLRYWQWYNLGDRDSGVVDLLIDGVGRPNNDDDDDDDKEEIEGRWRFQHSVIGSSRGRWVQVIVDLPKMYEGRRAQLAFTLEGRGDQSRPGWFMDDFRIETGPMNNKRQGFENGWEDWSVQGSVWDIGAPMTSKGPKPVTGKGLAGTDLFGEYPTENRVSSRLLSPRFVVPKDAKEPTMTYQSWHKLDRRDRGEVQIREEYGRWRSLRNTRVTGDEGDKWEKRTVDLSDYAGKEIQVGFLIDTRRSSEGDLGWYIDDVSLDLK